MISVCLLFHDRVGHSYTLAALFVILVLPFVQAGRMAQYIIS